MSGRRLPGRVWPPWLAHARQIPDNLAIMTINHCRQVAPTISPTGNMGHIHRPPLVTLDGTTPQPLGTRTRRARALMHHPTLQPERPIDRLPIDHEPLAVPQQRPQTPVPIGRILLKSRCSLVTNPAASLGVGTVVAVVRWSADRTTRKTRQVCRSEMSGQVALTRRTAPAPKGRASGPPVTHRSLPLDPQSFV